MASRLELEGDPGQRAELRFALARALWATKKDRARALELAGQARRDFAATEVFYDKEKQQLAAWLKRRME